MAADKPTIHASLADLDTEGKPEPYVYMTKGGKRVTFPDIFEMDWEEGDKFMSDLENKSTRAFMSDWLPEKDFDALRAEKLTLRQMGILVQKVMAHYQGLVGGPGEGDASKS